MEQLQALEMGADGLVPLRGQARGRGREVVEERARRLATLAIGRLTREAESCRIKLRGLVKGLHCKVAKHLSIYDAVVYPPPTSKEIVARRPLRARACRSLYCWGHFSLGQRVKQKVESSG